MGETTSISWAHSTFNPWLGCVEVSPACDHCYARTLVTGRMGKPVWGKEAPRPRTSADYWKQPLHWNAKAEEPHRVFCGSLCDVMEDREDLKPMRANLYDLIEATPKLTWLLLTKRPQNFSRFLPREWVLGQFPKNVWLGTTVEGRQYLWRVDKLREMYGAAVRFLSIEPLLESLGAINLDCIDWVLVGGESGGGSRPIHPDWVRCIRDECLQWRIPFHFKQWGDYHPITRIDGIHEPPFGFPGFQQMIRIGKKAAGHLLDGREWREFPEPRR